MRSHVLEAAFQILLLLLLPAAVVCFVVMGLLKHRHTQALGRLAHERALRFSPEDPLDLVSRYAGFALLSAGHSAQAQNVTHGRAGGVPFRACELSYEVAHGAVRMIRRYAAFWVEFAEDLPPVLLWNDRDAERAPAAVHLCDRRKASWRVLGDDPLASLLAGRCEALAGEGVSMQTCGRALMLCFPQDRWRGSLYLDRLAAVLDVAAGVSAADAPAASDGAPAAAPPKGELLPPER